MTATRRLRGTGRGRSSGLRQIEREEQDERPEMVQAQASMPERDAARALDWERAKVGDRLAGFAALLPAEPSGPVVMAVSPIVGMGLGWRFAGALLLVRAGSDVTSAELAGQRALRWDGEHPPVRPGSAGLLIVDRRNADPDRLRPLLARDGTIAILGPDGDTLVFPDVDRPEQLWRHGWPIPARPTPVGQLRRAVRLLTAGATRSTWLSVSGPRAAPSLADQLLDDLGTATGQPATLAGIQTAGDVILRVRQPRGELAVRVALTDPKRRFDETRAVAAEVAGVRPWIQRHVAEGVTAGTPWVATRWLPRQRPAMRKLSAVAAQQWAIGDQLAAELASVRTGAVDADWARRWCAGVAAVVTPMDLERLIAAARQVEIGAPTGWAHGDLWPGNILVDGADSAVIDWENSSRDAPLGLDWLLIAAMRLRLRAGISFAAACIRLVDEPGSFDQPVGGRRWRDWDRCQRVGLATAAYVLHLRNRAILDLGREQLARDLLDILALSPPPAGPERVPPADGRAGQAARGALWLGASALVVKALQTLVLLVLAALLAPSALGLIAIGTLVLNVSTVLGDLGTSSALVYWRGDVRRAARTAMTIGLIVSVAITAVVWLLAPALVHAVRADAAGVGVIRGLTSVLPCFAMATPMLELLRRELKFAHRIVPDLVATIAGTIVSITLALHGHGVAALVAGQIVQGVLTLVVAAVVAGPVLPGWNGADARGLLGYGGNLSGSNVAQLMLLNIDYLIVSRVLGSADLGQYSLAFRLAYLPYLNIAFVISGAAFPYLCRLTGEKLGVSAQRMTNVVLTGVIPLCAGIALLGEQLQLLGTKWAPAVPVVQWLMLYTVVLSFNQMVQTALNSAGRPRASFVLRTVHLIALGIALVILTPFGITAVAIGQVIAVGGVGLLSMVLAARTLPGFSVAGLFGSLWPAAVGAAAMVAVVVALNRALPGAEVSVARLVVLGVTGLVAYVLPVWLLDRKRLAQTLAVVRERV